MRILLQGFLALGSAGLLLYLVSLTPVAHAGGRAHGQFVVSVRVVASCSITTQASVGAARPKSRLVRVVCRRDRPYTLSYERGEVVPAGPDGGAANLRDIPTSGQAVSAAGERRRVMIVTVDF